MNQGFNPSDLAQFQRQYKLPSQALITDIDSRNPKPKPKPNPNDDPSALRHGRVHSPFLPFQLPC